MRITFLGTSYGRPLPARRCSCYMIETGGRIYFVDMGMSAVEYLTDHGYSMSKVSAIFITHMHGDHVGGLPQFMHMTNGHIKNCEPAVFLTKAESVNAVVSWLEAIDIVPRKRDYRITAEGVIYDDGTVKVTAQKTKHTDSSYAYMLEAEGKTIAFTSDLENPDTDFPTMLYGKSLAMLQLEGQHFHPKKYIPHLERLTADKLVFTHYANTQYDRIIEFCDMLPDDSGVIAAHDNLTLDV